MPASVLSSKMKPRSLTWSRSSSTIYRKRCLSNRRLHSITETRRGPIFAAPQGVVRFRTPKSLVRTIGAVVFKSLISSLLGDRWLLCSPPNRRPIVINRRTLVYLRSQSVHLRQRRGTVDGQHLTFGGTSVLAGAAG